MIKFNEADVTKYRIKCINYQRKHNLSPNYKQVIDDKADSIMSFFDKNCDGKITEAEFNKKKDDYIKFQQSYKDSTQAQEDLMSIDKLSEIFKKFNFIDTNKIKIASSWVLSNDYDEQKDNKPDIELQESRQERNLIDNNSKGIDFHIGTFNQGKMGTCTVLASTSLYSDEELKQIISKKQDKSGMVYYEVTFPNDSEKEKIIISEEELNNKELKYNGKYLSGFSEGDDDVTLLEMAYIKRYGTNIINNGAEGNKVLNIMHCDNKGAVYIGNEITEELLLNNIGSAAALLYTEQIKQIAPEEDPDKYIKDRINASLTRTYSDRSYTVYQLKNGSQISVNHAYAISRYDKETKTVFLRDPHESSTEIPVPLKDFKELFELAQ